MQLEFNLLAAVQIFWILIGLNHFLRRSDEVVLLSSLLIGYFSSYRYWTVISGIREWGDVGNLGFGRIDNSDALHALNAIVLGQSVMFGVYLLMQRGGFTSADFRLSPNFARRLQSFVVTATLILIPLTFMIRGVIWANFTGGFSDRLSNSAWLRLFPLILSTMAILLIFLWRYGGLPEGARWVNAALVLWVFYTTYQSQGRFQFLAWVVAGGLILTARYRPSRRLFLLSGLVVVVAMAFALAGTQRRLEVEDQKAAAWDRIKRAEDANMLDGFALMQQVIPSRFGYRYGMEHLEVFIRPIPRAWWPNKPVADYMLRVAGIDQSKGATIGISPSLFGSFYVEGGYLGIVLLSAIYGYLLGRFMNWATTLHPAGGLVLRGLICASLVAMLRGGDLPGIVAVLAMSFWPILGLIVFRRHLLKMDSPWFKAASAGAAGAALLQPAYGRARSRRTQRTVRRPSLRS